MGDAIGRKLGAAVGVASGRWSGAAERPVTRLGRGPGGGPPDGAGEATPRRLADGPGRPLATAYEADAIATCGVPLVAHDHDVEVLNDAHGRHVVRLP